MATHSELCARLRRMADMTTTNNDVGDVLRAANAIESQAREIAELRQDVARHLEIATRVISYNDALRARAEALQSKLDAYEHK